jgi:hypothetical protein
MIGTSVSFDPTIIEVLEKLSYQDITVPIGNWIANDKGDNIRFGIWSGDTFAGLQDLVVKYAVKGSVTEFISPGNIYDIAIDEKNLYTLLPYSTGTLKGLVLFGDYYKHPSKDFVLTEDKDVYSVILFNTDTQYFYGLSLPSKLNGQGLVDFSVNNVNSTTFYCKVLSSGQHARLTLTDQSLNSGNLYVNLIGSNPFYGTIVVSNKILTAS